MPKTIHANGGPTGREEGKRKKANPHSHEKVENYGTVRGESQQKGERRKKKKLRYDGHLKNDEEGRDEE